MSVQPDLTQTVVVTVQHSHQHNHSNQTYNSSQGSNDSPNNNMISSLDKIPTYAGGNGPDSPFLHDSSPSYSVPELPNMYPQSAMDAGQYSVPDSQYMATGRPYSPISHPQFNLQSAQSFSSTVPPSYPASSQFFPEKATGASGIPQRNSGNMGQVPANKTVVVEPTINHNLNSGVEKVGMKDNKSGLPPPSSTSSCDSRPLSQCDSLQDSRQSVISVQLPGNVDTEAVTWSTFSNTGGRLVLPESGNVCRFSVSCYTCSFTRPPSASSSCSRLHCCLINVLGDS